MTTPDTALPAAAPSDTTQSDTAPSVTAPSDTAPSDAAPSDSAPPDLGHPIVPEAPDERTEIPMVAGEREILDAWIELYRETTLWKIQGLTARQLASRPIPSSTLSLLGVLRHLTEVEAYWIEEVTLGREVPDMYSTREQPEGDFENGTAATAAADVAAYRDQLEGPREALAAWSDLEGPVSGLRHGKPVNLRWILSHLIEEYARHLGHMDMLREAVDGQTGY